MAARNQGRSKPKKQRRTIFAKRYQYDADAHPVHAYLDAFDEASRRTMASALGSVSDILSDGKVPVELLAWHLIRAQHTNALRGRMLRLFAPATTNRYLTALRGVLKAAWRLELVDRDTMEQALDVTPARGKRTIRGRAVTADELARLFKACAQDSNRVLGARDAAILALLYGAGLRRAEAATATVENFDAARGRLRVVGKGNKERHVFLPAGTLAAVLAWLQHRGSDAGPLFNQISKSCEVRPSGITAQLVYHIVRHRHLEAGLKPFTPHDLRRSHISALLDEGVDIVTVARRVGHSNIQTTARYDRRDEVTQQRGVLNLKVPFGR